MKFDYNFSEIEDNLNLPALGEFEGFVDADEDLLPVARFLKTKTFHNEYIEPGRIKFFYTNKPKKDGGRYTAGSLMVRSEIERRVDDRYDFIAIIYYPVFNMLDNEDKIIQLDKILCGIDLGTLDKPSVKKQQPDSKEFIGNLNFFGRDKVHDSSETVHLAIESIVQSEKEG
jgi:hypothetical protein